MVALTMRMISLQYEEEQRSLKFEIILVYNIGLESCNINALLDILSTISP